MKKSLLVLLLIPIIIFSFVTVSHSQYTITQLTDNDYTEYYPQINDNGWVVWYGSDGDSLYGIFLYDGTSTTDLTNNTNLSSPQINDNGYVVWTGCDGANCRNTPGGWEIFLYDGTSTTQLTNNDYDDFVTDINDNGYVVWTGCDGANCWDGPGDWEIFLYDGAGTIQLTDNDYNDQLPQINDNGYVVWMGCDGATNGYCTGGDWEIFLYDGTSITQLTNNDYSDMEPQINNNGYVVWFGCDGPDCGGGVDDREIFLYDGTSTTQLTNNDYNDVVTDINDNGYVVWTGGDGSEADEIFLATPCADSDGDGYYLESGCPEPLDCNDTNENIYPMNSNTYCDCEGEIQQGITEYCSGDIDEDCDGLVDDADPDCVGGTCAASAEASTYDASPVHGSLDLLRQMGFFLLPLAAVMGLMIRMRKR